VKPGDETINDFRGPMGRDPLIGSRVGDYEVQSILGQGAMGIVYRVQDAVIGKPAALKVLKPDYADDPDMVQRLIREARTVNAIRHPGIVDIFRLDTLPNGQPYIVMDLLEGEPLDVWIKRESPMPWKTVGPVLDEILGALYAAHQVGVIHRDLKPGNVFYESHPESRTRVKIIDFGLARQADRAGGSVRPTNPGTFIGTPAFMAPEQVLGTKVFPATDLYAVGGIAYQMLTGRLPHEAPSAIEVISLKMKNEPVAPRQWVPTLDEDVESWVMMMLEREPERRPESADDARRMLRRITDTRTRSDEKLKAVALKATHRGEVQTAVMGPQAQPAVPTVPAPRRQTGSQAPHQPSSSSGAVKRPPGMGVGVGTPVPSGGVVPKRQWGESRTVVVDEAAGKIGDSTMASTEAFRDPLPARVEDSTMLAEPRAPEQPSPFAGKTLLEPVSAVPEALRRSQAGQAVQPPDAKAPTGPFGGGGPTLVEPASPVSRAAPGEGSGAFPGEHSSLGPGAPRSKVPFIVMGVLVIIIALAGLVLVTR